MRTHPLAARAALLACALALAACSTTPLSPGASVPTRDATAARTAVPAPVLLISLDGVHPRYVTDARMPTLARLARDGVRAEWMTPSYPSLTFPNHYTLVTGLRPDRHGIVQNTMRDAALGRFSLSNRDAVGDGRWWGGEPIWNTVKKAGLPNATMFWPGAEADIGGMRPDRWRAFSYEVGIDERVDTVAGWMREPDATRPRIATLYFEHVDKAAHEYGPDSEQAYAAARTVDDALARLVAALDGRAVNLVVVSDHGMAPVPPDGVVAIEDMVDPALADVVTTGQSVGFAPKPGREREAEAALLGRGARWECWRKGELPARWRYGAHPRVPPIVCQMDEGVDAGGREWLATRPPGRTRGSHGYDPALPSMRAVFVAHGPAFKRGVVLPPFENVDVYPMLATLLGVAPAPHDGDAATLRAALVE